MPRHATTIIIGMLLTSTVALADDWKTVAVPGEHKHTGYGWYRTWFKPHGSFFSTHERDLFGESVILNIRGLAGAHAVYVNGIKIGSGGQFPPQFQDGRDGNHRHKIPSGTLVQDQWNELAIQVYNPRGNGGFLTEAPFVMNYFWECVLAGKWEFRLGDTAPPLGNALKIKPQTSAFEVFQESSRVLGEASKLVHGDKLPPKQSLAKMHVPNDLIVELMVAEPFVAQPTHFSFDAKGRLWVAQYRQYPYPAGVKMVSRDRYYRSHYDKTPPPPPNHDHGRDVISIHQDTNGDGKYDSHKIFQDGLNMANAVVRGRGGVWVMHTPYLLFYPDEDFDDVPDGDPVVHLQGFGLEDTHSVANGLVWGMDGWLYGAQGSTASCHVTRPRLDAPNDPGVYFQGCMVWRYHPETRRFEIFAEGGGNNFGLEVDSGGRLFTGNNGGTTRGWHYVQGGMHLMQGTTPEKFGPPRNPFAFGELPKMESEQAIPRFTHFATFVESTAMPEKYRQTFLSVEPLHNFVIASERIVNGSTFSTNDVGKVLTSDDFAFRPVYIGNAPDGSVLVADFYEHYIAHGQHYQSQIDPTSGRIYRLRGKYKSLELDLDLDTKTTDQLIQLLNHPNRWHRHTAVRLIGERKEPGSASKLRHLVRSGEPLESLAALWALHQAFGLDGPTALVALQHSYSPIRYWAVRLICDDVGFAHKRATLGLTDSLGTLSDGPTRVANDLFHAILQQASSESNAEVRSQMAGSARRLSPDQALALLAVLLRHEEDLDDPYLPLLCWWVMEANLERSRDAVMQLFEDADLRREPMMIKHLLARTMRYLALKGKQRDLQHCTRLLQVVDDQDQVDQLLNGFELAYAGRAMTGLPKKLAEALTDSGRSSLSLRVRLGGSAAVQDGITLLKNEDADVSQRLSMVRLLGELKVEAALTSLLDIAVSSEDARLQRAAMTAVSNFDDPSIGKQLLDSFSGFSTEVHSAFFDLMLSRTEWTRRLIESIADESFGRDSISDDVVEQLRRHHDPAIRELATKQFGASEVMEADQVKQSIEKLRVILSDAPGNPYTGEALFMQRCAACHKLFHKGASVGPDLTPYQRGNFETLLHSIIAPSAEIREGFEYMILVTTDGRIITGSITDQDTEIVTVRTKAAEDVHVRRAEVESVTPVGRSMMPDGLLDGLTNQQLRDFFAYLRISQPISR